MFYTVNINFFFWKINMYVPIFRNMLGLENYSVFLNHK